MFQDLPDDWPFVDETDYLHLSLTVRTQQRINLPDLLNALPPLRWWYFARLVIRDIDNFNFVIRAFAFFLFQLQPVAISPHPVRIPAHIPHKLKALFRYMLGDSGNELFRRGDGKVLLVFAMGHPGMIDHHAGIIVVAQFGSGKRTSYDILSQVGYSSQSL